MGDTVCCVLFLVMGREPDISPQSVEAIYNSRNCLLGKNAHEATTVSIFPFTRGGGLRAGLDLALLMCHILCN